MHIAGIVRAAADLGRHFATTPTGGVERRDAIVDVITYGLIQHHLMTAWGRVAWTSRATALAAAVAQVERYLRDAADKLDCDLVMDRSGYAVGLLDRIDAKYISLPIAPSASPFDQAKADELARDDAATVRQWRQLVSQALYVMRGCAPHGLTPDAA